jgi:diguanylate cyclase (GGDEF)-like protein
MTELHVPVDDAPAPAVPVSYARLTWLTVAAAVLISIVCAATLGWSIPWPAQFALLSAFVLAGELLPMPVPRRGALDKVTISTPFAFALLLTAGVLPACFTYAASSAIADVSAGVSRIKVVFNAAQYVVSLAAAGGVLVLAGAAPPVAMTGGNVPAILLAAVVCLVVNHILAGTGAALLGGRRILPYLSEDLPFHACTAGCLISLAPGVVTCAQTSLALIPVSFIPMLAIYFGGRQAAITAHRAVHDLLTDLPNRSQLSTSLRAALESADHSGRSMAVMLVDLDDFKAVNDTLGHEFGDRVLMQIAPRLQEAVGERGMLARLGGDEFAIVLERVHSDEETAAAARRVLDSLDRPLDVDGLALRVSGSVGVACYPQHGRTVDELLRHADVALYCAKANRSSFAVYEHEQDDYSVDRLALAAQLRRGIDRGEVVVHYQPKVPLRDGRGLGAEALVRWNHPQLGRIGPDGFIPLAEQSGLITVLTEHVLEAAVRQCADWHASGLDVRVSVNISTRSLLDRELPATIDRLLRQFGVRPASLQLEITESRIVADPGNARTVLGDLRAMGVTIAIDDFGTGFSSLSQLQQLPVDEIKIDRSFVTRMEIDRDDAVLVRSIVDLGRNLGLRVTAEGVETASAHRTLCELGCDFAQGFHTGRAVPADECRRLLESVRPPLHAEPILVEARAGSGAA